MPSSVQDIFNLEVSQKETSGGVIESTVDQMKRLLGADVVESFSFRTCVSAKLKKDESTGELQILYSSRTAQEEFQQ